MVHDHRKQHSVKRRQRIHLQRGCALTFQGVKSTEGIDICWVEEAQTVSRTVGMC